MHIDDSEDRENYVLKHCRDFMTSRERKIINASGKLRLQYQGNANEKSRLIMWSLTEADKDRLIEQVLIGDPKPILTKIAKRIIIDHQHAIKTCPDCGYVLRTPKAMQCRKCFKSWHD